MGGPSATTSHGHSRASYRFSTSPLFVLPHRKPRPYCFKAAAVARNRDSVAEHGPRDQQVMVRLPVRALAWVAARSPAGVVQEAADGR